MCKQGLLDMVVKNDVITSQYFTKLNSIIIVLNKVQNRTIAKSLIVQNFKICSKLIVLVTKWYIFSCNIIPFSITNSYKLVSWMF